jgi:predicted GIY-YIG superfamily endonuclease
MGYYVYIIKSLKSGKIYTGISKNPEKRLREHNKGDSKFTKGHRPWVLVYKEFVGDRRKARLREKELKRSYSKRIKILNNIPG